jgi:hypothetical protein
MERGAVLGGTEPVVLTVPLRFVREDLVGALQDAEVFRRHRLLPTLVLGRGLGLGLRSQWSDGEQAAGEREDEPPWDNKPHGGWGSPAKRKSKP